MAWRVKAGQPAGDEAGEPRRPLRRLVWLKVFFLAFFALVAGRLVMVQVINAGRYQEYARRQYEVRETLPGTRGPIADRNGNVLVSNVVGVSFGADPKFLGTQANVIATRFSRALGKSREYYLEKLAGKGKRFVWLERHVSPQRAKSIQTADLAALVELREPYRLYHYEHLGGQVIGSTDVDNRGLSGIELTLDSYLRGKDGYVVFQRDGRGNKVPSVDYPRLDPTVGCSATLTLDIEYQTVAEEELERGVERSQAEGGLVVMMDPGTGEILAMANHPSMDPSNPAGISESVMRNRVITDYFEPGSVFKVVTAAAALERDLVKPDQKFYAEQGSYIVRFASGKPRNTITDVHPYGMLTFQEAIEKSSNIVLAKISDRIGSELLYTTARNFGFGIETGIDLPGEVNGDLKKPSLWSGTTLNSMAYGYGVGLTPIQLASAYAAVANRGVLMKPYVVQRLVDASGNVIRENSPQVVRRVVSEATASTLTRFLEGAVLRGTGVLARVQGVRIAGKTGTSRKAVDGKYELDNYTASFVGYFPAENPKVVCLVMLDNPRGRGYTGGEASAPIFREIAHKVYAMSGRFQQKRGAAVASAEIVMPNVLSMMSDIAREMLERRGFSIMVAGNGPVVKAQVPRAGERVGKGTAVRLVTSDRSSVGADLAVVPDLRGMPIRRAITTLAAQQLEATISGSGVVVSQLPDPGRQVKTGSRVHVVCEPRGHPLLSMN